MTKYVFALSTLVAMLLSSSTAQAQNQKRLGAYYYYGDHWANPKYTAVQIPYTNITHLFHVVVEPIGAADGTIKIYEGALESNLVTQAHQAGVKVIACVQGPAAVFSKVAADGGTRTRFGESLKEFVTKYDYDGVDIDWEVPQGAADVTNCTSMMQALRDAMPSPRYLLSMATPSTPGGWGEYDFKGLIPILDYFNVMTYDYHGPWTKHAGHNSPLFSNAADPGHDGSLDDSVSLYLNKFSVPPEKINLGTAFYGYEFGATNLHANASADKKTRSRNYSYIKKLIGQNGWTRCFDPIAMAPYLLHSSEPAGFITYDDPESTARKVAYALQVRNLGGVFMWEISGDYDGNDQELMAAMWKAFVRATGSRAGIKAGGRDGAPRVFGAKTSSATQTTPRAKLMRH